MGLCLICEVGNDGEGLMRVYGVDRVDRVYGVDGVDIL